MNHKLAKGTIVITLVGTAVVSPIAKQREDRDNPETHQEQRETPRMMGARAIEWHSSAAAANLQMDLVVDRFTWPSSSGLHPFATHGSTGFFTLR